MTLGHPEGIDGGMGSQPQAPALNQVVLEGGRECRAVGITALASVVHRIEAGMNGEIVAVGFAAIEGHGFLVLPQLLPETARLQQGMGADSMLPAAAAIPGQRIAKLAR